ncbi:MAG: Na+/solute symporter [Bacteroidetes bacterium]|nr:MAG: Na+/solute symporter [Bacteroidota bacterium]
MLHNLIFIVFILYTLVLFGVAFFTSRKSNNESYFNGNRKSPWPVVAYGMIGASLSGVTFISIPGWVGNTQFTYLMVVFGYLIGYLVITYFLLPLYYRLNLISIYTYLEQRFGFYAYKTGAFYFLVSRTIGASFRMFLVINVLQIFIFDKWGLPFWGTTLIFVVLITLYTFKAGIKTIVWTDLLQTTFMLASLVITIYAIASKLDINILQLFERAKSAGYTTIIDGDWRSDRFYLKQFFSGMFITIVMTGLDQDMMQKNLTCRNVKDAQKNMISLGLLLIPVNMLFLFLGASLYVYATDFGIVLPNISDDLFPVLAFEHFGPVLAVVFLIGLIAAAYSSADGAITALTTSFIIDILGNKNDAVLTEDEKKKRRYKTHFFISSLIILTIVLFREINDQAVISRLFTIAGYTYGPLLGLFAFGMFTNKNVKDKLVPVVAIIAPLLSYIVSSNSDFLLNGYKFGFEILIFNGLLTFIGLFIIQKK